MTRMKSLGYDLRGPFWGLKGTMIGSHWPAMLCTVGKDGRASHRYKERVSLPSFLSFPLSFSPSSSSFFLPPSLSHSFLILSSSSSVSLSPLNLSLFLFINVQRAYTSSFVT